MNEFVQEQKLAYKRMTDKFMMGYHERVENSKCFSRNMMVAFRSPSLNS
jgi:hypothetical protein